MGGNLADRETPNQGGRSQASNRIGARHRGDGTKMFGSLLLPVVIGRSTPWQREIPALEPDKRSVVTHALNVPPASPTFDELAEGATPTGAQELPNDRMPDVDVVRHGDTLPPWPGVVSASARLCMRSPIDVKST